MIPRRTLPAVVVLAIALAACGGGSKVGDESLLDFEGKGAGRLGQIKDSPKPTAPPPTKSAPPTKRATPKPVAPVAKVWDVSIDSQGYKPFNFRVFHNDKIRVTNNDSQARSFTADDGTFDSGLIAPGASWTYVASKPGTFNVSDSTRPFVVGKVEVIKRS